MNEILAPAVQPVWLRSDLKSAGHSDRDISLLVGQGVLRRLRRGAYADAATFDAADAAGRHRLLAQAVVMQAKTEVVVSHTSAVCFHEGPTWGLPMDEVHISRLDGRAGRAAAGVRQHHRPVLPEDVVVRDGIEVMSATRTALEVTTCASTEVSLVVVDDLLHRGLTTKADLEKRYASMVHDPFTLKTDLVLRLSDPRPESVGEVRTVFMCYRGGVPAPTPQYKVREPSGDVVARLDFAWPHLGVWLEFDGREKYLKYRREGESAVDAVVREKERESMIAELTGWRCIRITWADLARPEATVARILAMLGVSPRVTSVSR
jgi:hypothetical protein